MVKKVLFAAGALLVAATVSAFVFSNSCSNGDIRYSAPEFKKMTTARFELMTDELVGVNSVNDMYLYKSYIVLVSYNAKIDSYIHIFDKHTGTCVNHSIHRGRGSHEVMFNLMPTFDVSSGILSFYDLEQSRRMSFQIDSLVAGTFSGIWEPLTCLPLSKACDLPNGNRLYFHNESFLHPDDIPRFELVSPGGDVLSSDDSWLEIDDLKKRYLMYISSILEVSPDGSKCLFSPEWGGIFEIYSLSGNRLQKEHTAYFIEPHLSPSAGGAYADFSPETILAFNDIFVTDDNIYCSYDGVVKPYYTWQLPVDEKPLYYTKLVIFDWNCKGLKCIKTDYRIERICVDESTDTVYAIVKDKYGCSFLARMPLLSTDSE